MEKEIRRHRHKFIGPLPEIRNGKFELGIGLAQHAGDDADLNPLYPRSRPGMQKMAQQIARIENDKRKLSGATGFCIGSSSRQG
jgi:hypothetical protein